ncbi:MAG TPA: glycoside hydrolase family 2 TIM barrel-domain containing protein [Sphaerochaeta sp.]|nr:glycoside hydrolase family 2 TIM barrel-domain containing protein [Sphaerochaeta sp.]
MDTRIPANDGWLYSPDYKKQYCQKQYDDSQWEVVDLPHANVLLPRHYFDEQSFCFVSTYRKQFHKELPDGYSASLRFEGIASQAKVYGDGALLFSHKGGYLPFEVPLGKKSSIQLTVVVDSSEDAGIPPFGGSIDYLTFGGIYREVNIILHQEQRILSLLVESQNPEEVRFRGRTAFAAGLTYTARILDGDQELCRIDDLLLHDEFDSLCTSLSLQSWEPENPKLYTFELTLENGETESVRFGSRSVVFAKDGFYLNGKMRKLIGLNRHQSYPYVGYAMPENGQREDAQRLKELGVDLVRTSHYPQHPAFLDACDELGLLVMEEIPGWQHVSESEQWRRLCLESVEGMIERDFNHPSIILWGVRINESGDDDELYGATNALARKLDPSRQTGGVRNFAKSSFLEDVYTYNDFSHDGTNAGLARKGTICSTDFPYMVTEFCGHMFPTKRYDNPQQRKEHALRHYRTLDAMFGSEGISGAIGWCMNDYNTHSNFGSGDQVCYHGVCDQGRAPKLAAFAYMSQKESSHVMVLSSAPDNGDFPKASIGSLLVATNCDCVRVFFQDEEVGTYYPDRKAFPHLPHPPVLLTDLIGKRLEKETYLTLGDRNRLRVLLNKVGSQAGSLTPLDKARMLWFLLRYRLKYDDAVALFTKYVGNWGSEASLWRFEGLVAGEVVCTESYGEHKEPYLELETRSTKIHLGDTYSMLCINVSIRKTGMTMPLPYAHEPFTVSVEGPLKLVSPALAVCEGGTAVVYVRTIGEKGKAQVTISSSMGDKTLEFTVL